MDSVLHFYIFFFKGISIQVYLQKAVYCYHVRFGDGLLAILKIRSAHPLLLQ